ncbi:hypothetical protein BN2475_490047 [Paraburkholderia ribeironis]|uniref:Uncharacterized protein n=1 Tax=Paraburkholderia ribeironis TaxID=1247936 RepID=A0A1N7SBP5_9BURK|nr:hypothetical protein BN2475_490047 [Paraburkholderia ribeironis]
MRDREREAQREAKGARGAPCVGTDIRETPATKGAMLRERLRFVHGDNGRCGLRERLRRVHALRVEARAALPGKNDGRRAQGGSRCTGPLATLRGALGLRAVIIPTGAAGLRFKAGSCSSSAESGVPAPSSRHGHGANPLNTSSTQPEHNPSTTRARPASMRHSPRTTLRRSHPKSPDSASTKRFTSCYSACLPRKPREKHKKRSNVGGTPHSPAAAGHVR